MENITQEDLKTKSNLLYKGKWLSIYDYDTYEYCKLEQCNNSSGVAILVYRNDQETPILGSFEIIPCHHDGTQLCCITGRIDENQTAKQAAIIELREEAGYNIKEDELAFLGICRPVKFSDHVIYLYAIDVTNKERYEKIIDKNSDTTKEFGEHKSYCDWVSMLEFLMCKDPTAPMLVARLNAIINKSTESQLKESNGHN